MYLQNNLWPGKKKKKNCLSPFSTWAEHPLTHKLYLIESVGCIEACFSAYARWPAVLSCRCTTVLRLLLRATRKCAICWAKDIDHIYDTRYCRCTAVLRLLCTTSHRKVWDFAELNRHVLTFLHPILQCMITYWAPPLEMLSERGKM
jgi:hypothetical protein